MPTLWIIDDNLSLLNSLEVAFHGDFQITTFSRPYACLLAFREGKMGKPEVVLTDYEMPGMNGLDLVQEILKECPWIRVYLISSALNDDLIARARQIGVQGWMGKPFDLGELKRMIEIS